ETIAFETRHRRKDGMIFPVEVRGKAFREGGQRFTVTLARDVTERKRAEQELREARDELEKKVTERTAELRRSERHLAEAQRLSHTGSWTWDPCGRRPTYWSEEMFRIWCFDPSQGPPSADTAWQRIHPEDRQKVQEHIEQARRCDQKVEVVQDHRIVLP